MIPRRFLFGERFRREVRFHSLPTLPFCPITISLIIQRIHLVPRKSQIRDFRFGKKSLPTAADSTATLTDIPKYSDLFNNRTRFQFYFRAKMRPPLSDRVGGSVHSAEKSHLQHRTVYGSNRGERRTFICFRQLELDMHRFQKFSQKNNQNNFLVKQNSLAALAQSLKTGRIECTLYGAGFPRSPRTWSSKSKEINLSRDKRNGPRRTGRRGST